MAKKNNKNIYISGEGGKGGGGGRVAQEAPNTLRTTTVVRVLELLSEGPIVGLATNDGQSIFLNGTPLQNSDGSYNFARGGYDYRTGLASQPYMSGFPSASATVTVGTNVTAGPPPAPAIKTTSSAAVDAVKVAVGLPVGLTSQDTSNGDLNGSSVEFAIDRKASTSGTWENVLTPTIEGKAVTAYERQYYITKPSGCTGTWDIRVRRITADSASSALKNDTKFDSIVEIQEVQLPYNNSAYVGIAIDAESVGNQIPVRAYLIKGIICAIPSNYNAGAGTYSGTWDGTFTSGWTNNPAWILYDLLTNTRYGMGRYGMTTSQIDKWSFYNAGVYNDGLVPDGAGGYERRFTFDAPIAQRDDMLKVLQNVAGMMNSTLVYSGGLITINQDRPSSAVKLVTKANVIGGTFTRSGSNIATRYTSCNVTWNDKANNKYLPVVSTVTDATGVSTYGFNPVDVAAYGATTEGQAIRVANWMLYTSLNQTENISFSMGMNGFDLAIGNVIKLYDEDYTAQAGAGRIVSATSNTVTFDRPVVISGSASVDVLLPDGVTVENHAISTGAGTHSTVTITGTWSVTPVAYADYIVTSAVSPQTFRITGLSQDESAPHQVKVDAVFYDAAKYAAVELGYTIPSATYSAITATTIGEVGALTFQPIGVANSEGVKRSIVVKWTKPTVGIPTRYTLKWRRNYSDYTTVENIGTTAYEIPNCTNGTYDVVVQAINVNNQSSRGTSGSYTLDTSNGTGSALNPVTSLIVVGGGTSFATNDLNVQWTNPSTNSNIGATVLKDFQVDVLTTGDVLLRTEYVGAGTQPGATCLYSYTYSKNSADSATPNRSVKIRVYARDTNNKTSTATTVTFTNAAPAVPSNISVTGGVGSVYAKFDMPTAADYKGVLVWASLTTGFTPSSSNLAYDGADNLVTIKSLGSGTHYVKIAAYDTFGKDYAGTGLNVSTQYSTTSVGSTYILSGAGLPGSGTEGDFFYNTSDGQLYRFHSGAWTAAVPAVNITGTLSDSQLASIAAAKLTGQITTTQITDNSISTAKLMAGSVTTNEIAANTITAADIAAATITATQVAAGTLTGTQIAGNTITGSHIVANTITAGKLAASTITSNEIAAATITANNIVGGEITSTYISSSSGTYTSLSVTVPSGAQGLVVHASFADSQSSGGGKDPYTIVAANAGRIDASGYGTLVSGAGAASWGIASPSAGTYTLTAYRALASGYTNLGDLLLTAQVLKR